MTLIHPIEKKRKSASYNIIVRGELGDELRLALAFLEAMQLQGEETLTLPRLIAEIIRKSLQDNRKLIEGFEKKERYENYAITVPGDVNEQLEAAFAREKARFGEEEATLPKFIVQILVKALKDDRDFRHWKRERLKNADVTAVPPAKKAEEKLTEASAEESAEKSAEKPMAESQPMSQLALDDDFYHSNTE